MKRAHCHIPSFRDSVPPRTSAVQPIAFRAKPDSLGSYPLAIGWLLLILSALLLALFRAAPVRAAGVVGTGTPQSCTEAALGAALADGGLVTFDCGADSVTITLTAEKVIAAGTAQTTVDGGGLVTLSGGDAVSVFRVGRDAVLELRNLTVAHGYSGGNGGGIDNTGSLTATSSTFAGNSAFNGGGIASIGSLTVTNSTFAGNSAEFLGGGILSSGSLTVTSSTFAGNSAFGGGGILDLGSLTVTNSTFTGNSADSFGGDIQNGGCFAPGCASGALTVINSTIAGNSAGTGGGISNARGTLAITNTIIANDCLNGDTVTDGGHNLIEDADNACGLTDGLNGNIIGVDPLLDPAGLADNGGPTETIALLDGSPAIDAGDPEACANPPVNGVDQRGRSRPGSGSSTCSIGALEFEPPGPPTCTGDCNRNGTVAINELILGVNIALGRQPLASCPGVDRNGQNGVEINELITAVINALTGCALDPARPGPFAVGVRQITFTKPSETRPGEQRVLLTDIWYPTAPGAGPVDPALGGVRDAPLADGTRALPLLLFSHGSCWFPDESRFLTTTMASYGFIVAAPPHPGNLYSDPDCLDLMSIAESYLNREPDVIFVIDALLQLNTESTSFLHAAIDPTRIGVSGHSFGGQTALRVAADDPRAIAALALAPWVPFAPVSVPLGIPVMVQGGTLDAVISFETNALREYEALGPPRYLVEIQRTGHDAFSDECYPVNQCDVAPPEALTQDEAHWYVLRYAVPFLLHWVARDNRFDALLAPRSAPPGVLFTADLGGERP